ncbi:unnamed protein product [Chondrus crispus]|uniref:Glucose-methanol-choline oxidoreductase N-terminal domain-containing protein n=1 Tax=Chondrus crispus TaxID=2769 RepID=R7QK16_CHOCR|nr:unnamed protein product [Chondrus crispus]CDF37821.1 unnamed protein product [Chondrus crispus]|eukprot:XP_005717692.1 unnamed protein product [Chondrus crispus]
MLLLASRRAVASVGSLAVMPSLSLLLLLVHMITIADASPEAASPDFVIVGGGTAGCTIAARLCSRVQTASVVVLERGVPRSPQSELLMRAARNIGRTWEDPNLSQTFQSEPDPSMAGQRQEIIDANTLGGASSINAMQWGIPLGNKEGRWGIRGLSSRVAKRFYRRAYRKVGFAQQPQSLRQLYGDEYADAASRTRFTREFSPFKTSLREAVWEMAVAVTPSGRRIDSCTAYLKPVLNGRCRRNLRLIQGTTVTRVLLDNSTVPRAIGVEYVDSKDTRLTNKNVLLASKEVILSAGPFGSPKLLQLSGIGPRSHLQAANVETRVDLPVGQRTQSRALGFVSSQYYKGQPLEPSNNSTILNGPETLRSWRRRQPSVLGSTGFATMAVLKDIGYVPMSTANDATTLDERILQSFCLTNPTSYGYLRILDGDPFSTPKVLLNALGSRTDVNRMRTCLERFVRVHRNLPASFQLETTCPAPDFNDTQLRQRTSFSLHFVGGCRVGAVVRSDLSVKGVEGLRVVDSSVFRSMPVSAGPMASTYMLAEFVADKLAKMYARGVRRKSVW